MREHMYQIRSLHDFYATDENGRDRGGQSTYSRSRFAFCRALCSFAVRVSGSSRAEQVAGRSAQRPREARHCARVRCQKSSALELVRSLPAHHTCESLCRTSSLAWRMTAARRAPRTRASPAISTRVAAAAAVVPVLPMVTRDCSLKLTRLFVADADPRYSNWKPECAIALHLLQCASVLTSLAREQHREFEWARRTRP